MDRVNELNVTAPKSRGIKLGGQIRTQFQARSDFDFDSKGGDSLDFTILRTRVTVDADIDDHLRVFVELQDTRFFGIEGSVVGNISGFDIYQAFTEFRDLWDEPFSIYVGRRTMSYGDQRLISSLDWHPYGRSWDGIWLEYEPEGKFIHLFATRIDEKFLTSGVNENEDFIGLYGSHDSPRASSLNTSAESESA